MEEERKKREAQDNMEKAKIKKELAKKAAEVSDLRVNWLQRVSYLTEKHGGLCERFSPSYMVTMEHFPL